MPASSADLQIAWATYLQLGGCGAASSLERVALLLLMIPTASWVKAVLNEITKNCQPVRRVHLYLRASSSLLYFVTPHSKRRRNSKFVSSYYLIVLWVGSTPKSPTSVSLHLVALPFDLTLHGSKVPERPPFTRPPFLPSPGILNFE